METALKDGILGDAIEILAKRRKKLREHKKRTVRLKREIEKYTLLIRSMIMVEAYHAFETAEMKGDKYFMDLVWAIMKSKNHC